MIRKTSKQWHPHKQAFTLIELLVVIAIIALLMGILMPALSAVRKQAASIACQSNIRQMTMAMNLYTQNNDGKTMPFTHTAGKYWFFQLAPFLSAKDYKNDPEGHKEQMEVAFCPSAKKRRPETNWGTATTAWRFMEGEGSYGMNLWLLPNNKVYPEFEKANYYKKYTNANANVPVIGDSVWVGSYPYHTDFMPEDLTGEIGYPGYPHAPQKYMGRFCIDRHNKAINLSFGDSHIERVQLKDLWLKNWHRNFKATTEVKTDRKLGS
ncbi:MAG: type II secretion system protein [Phycisphaeraceae bacterium]|nr:type II secretion system protein [Phycisphaeraceae bacterium]